MTITCDVLSKKAIALYEASVVGNVFCVYTDRKGGKIRLFGVETNGYDAKELYFSPLSVVGLSDVVTIKNRGALKGKFSIANGLKKLPLNCVCYSPLGKILGRLEGVETDVDNVTSFIVNGVNFAYSKLVSLSSETVILSDSDDYYKAVSPRKQIPKVSDDRTVSISSDTSEKNHETSVNTTYVNNNDLSGTEKEKLLHDQTISQAKVTAFPQPSVVNTDNANRPPATHQEDDASTNKQPIKPVVIPPAVAEISKSTIKINSSAPPVRASVMLPQRADATVTKSLQPNHIGKSGYSFLIGKTATRTILDENGNVIICTGETITDQTLSKLPSKLILLALYSK